MKGSSAVDAVLAAARLVAELGPSGELPSLCELARRLLVRTEHWQVPELPPYPAFR